MTWMHEHKDGKRVSQIRVVANTETCSAVNGLDLLSETPASVCGQKVSADRVSPAYIGQGYMSASDPVLLRVSYHQYLSRQRLCIQPPCRSDQLPYACQPHVNYMRATERSKACEPLYTWAHPRDGIHRSFKSPPFGSREPQPPQSSPGMLLQYVPRSEKYGFLGCKSFPGHFETKSLQSNKGIVSLLVLRKFAQPACSAYHGSGGATMIRPVAIYTIKYDDVWNTLLTLLASPRDDNTRIV